MSSIPIPQNKPWPLVNLKVIGTRPEPIVPDGVWIEIQPCAGVNDAVNNAYYEEERINARNLDQAERLRLFQRATQKRVTQAANLLQKNAVQEVSKKIDEERAILHRSVSAAERSTPKKNRCFYNIDQITIDGGRGTSSRTQVDPKSKFMNDVDIDVKSKKASTQRKFACQKLTEKVFESNIAAEDRKKSQNSLNGGIRRHRSSKYKSPKVDGLDCAESEETELQTVKALHAPLDVAIASLQESITEAARSSTSTDLLQVLLATNCLIDDETEVNRSDQIIHPQQPSSSHAPHSVHFDQRQLESGKVVPIREVLSNINNTATDFSKQTISQPEKKQKSTQKNYRLVQNTGLVLRPGAVEINEKKASERARWMSRRVFADAEREQAREVLRMKAHKQHVDLLKCEKERERRELEVKSRHQVEAVALAQEQLKINKKKEETNRRRRKEKEEKNQQKQQRFVAAVRNHLKQRVEQSRIELPALCMCGETFWDTNPNTCANNCMFYNNQDAYAKALQAVLEVVERNITPFHKDGLQRCAVSLPLVTEDFKESAPSVGSLAANLSLRSNLSSALTIEKLQ